MTSDVLTEGIRVHLTAITPRAPDQSLDGVEEFIW